ncbi:MAG TPA: phosphodiesterase [Candidatus Fournierella merdavium]|nr:phosphodiesterase [Candidatus Fournierella merdavium]
MKIMFASDIHGSAYYCRRMLEVYEASGASRLVILGDILYHGPRNDLPREYAPKEVIAMLNPLKNQIYAVRGNCDTEVDQMVLEFPILADYTTILLENGHTLFATHGHLFDPDHLPPLPAGSAFAFGHIHVKHAERQGDTLILNPGSVSLPKDGSHSYMVYENGTFTAKTLEGEPVASVGW